MIRSAVFTLPLLALAACEGGGDPVQQALRDASAERQAAAYQGYDQVSPAPSVSSAADDQGRADALLARHRATLAEAQRIEGDAADPALGARATAARMHAEAEIEALEAWRPVAPPKA